MLNITKKNRDFFRRSLPHNYCDRFCERCEEMRDECQLYMEETRFQFECLCQRKDPNDPKVAFEHIQKILEEAMDALKDSMRKKGLKVSVVRKENIEIKLKKSDRRSKREAVYRLCFTAGQNLQKFLDEFSPADLAEPLPWVNRFWQDELEELSFYGPLIVIKAEQALNSYLSDGKKIRSSRPEYLVSGSLSYFSILAAEKSLLRIRKLIASQEPIWVLRINKIILDLGVARQALREKFPAVEQFKNKIIFHGQV